MLNIKETLHKHGIKASIPRIKIYEYLYHNRTHPTADEIYSDLHIEYPSLSKTTVYNTLKIFEELHIINSLSLDKAEQRFDLVDYEHAHFKCEICSNVYDIDIGDIQIEALNDQGFDVTHKQVYITGICPDCKNI